MLAGELNNSVSSIPDFPMHLACPEEEEKTAAAAAAEMAVQAAGDESISSLSELEGPCTRVPACPQPHPPDSAGDELRSSQMT